MPRVAIIGTGLIGSSIGLRLRESDIDDLTLVGYDKERGVSRQAKRIGAIHEEARDEASAVRGCSLVILSTPVLALRTAMEAIGPALERDVVVTDTGSTKTEVMGWAETSLPRQAFVGGHPMAGKTDAGPKFAEASLFEGAHWAIVPSGGATEGAVRAVQSLVETLGAKTMFMDAGEHDAYVAAISHLPMMAATALFTLAHGSDAWPELSRLAAGGFKDASRLAGTERDVAFDIAVTNRTQIVHWIARYREALLDLQERLADEDGEEELFRYLAQASWDHANFVEAGPTERATDDGSDLPRMDFASFLMGEAMASRMRDITRRSEERLVEAERKQRLTRG